MWSWSHFSLKFRFHENTQKRQIRFLKLCENGKSLVVENSLNSFSGLSKGSIANILVKRKLSKSLLSFGSRDRMGHGRGRFGNFRQFLKFSNSMPMPSK